MGRIAAVSALKGLLLKCSTSAEAGTLRAFPRPPRPALSDEGALGSRRRPAPSRDALDVSPADCSPMLVTARVQKRGAVTYDDVAVVAASALVT